MEQNETTLDSTQEIESTETTEEAVEEQTETVEEKDWKAEAAKWRRLAQKKDKNPQPKLSDKQEVSNKPVLVDEIEARVELRLDGYTKAEIDEIAAIAKAKGVSLYEAKDLPLIKKGIEGLRAERKASDDTPTPSKRGVVFKGKSFNEIIADPKASDADRQAAFEATMRRGRGGNASI